MIIFLGNPVSFRGFIIPCKRFKYWMIKIPVTQIKESTESMLNYTQNTKPVTSDYYIHQYTYTSKVDQGSDTTKTKYI